MDGNEKAAHLVLRRARDIPIRPETPRRARAYINRMSARLRLGALLVLLLAWPAGEALAQRVALVVGAGAYRHVPPLPNAVNDATDLAGSLRGLGFTVDLVTDPDRAALERAVERFGTAARGAEAALFFYAGHAVEVAGRNWIIPVSAELRTPQQLRFQALELEAVTEQTQAAARLTVIVLDACRDNPFRQRWPTASRSAAGQGLARISPATGTLVVFSTAPGAVAEDGQGRNSPFTAALLRHLPTPGLEIRPLLAEVRRTVREATRGAQVPWEESSLEGSFYFRPDAPAPAPRIAPTPPAHSMPGNDALAWQFVLNSRSPADFETFLRQFPDSVFAPFARNRLAELREASPSRAPDRLAALPVPPPATPAPPADPHRLLTRAEIAEAQRLLTGMGFDTGGADGAVGPRSRDALRAFALAADQPETLDFTADALNLLRSPPPRERRAAALLVLARRALPADPTAAARLARASLALRPDPDAQRIAEEASAALAARDAAARPAALPVPAAPPAAPAPSPAPLPAPAAGPAPFRCPPPGLRLVFADGATRTYLGAAPGDPEICLAGNAANPTRLLFNLHALPAEDERTLRAGMRELFPAAPGRGTSFGFIAATGGSTTAFRDTWRILRRETLDLASGPRATLVMERRVEGQFGNISLSVHTYWWDIATGAFLRRDVEVIRGLSNVARFQVDRLEQR